MVMVAKPEFFVPSFYGRYLKLLKRVFAEASPDE